MIVEGDTGMNTSISGLLLAAVLLVFSSSATWAGTVERQCGKMGPAYGADAYECTLKFSGEIVQGDAALIEASIRSSPYHVSLVRFDSQGGNPFEALKISDILNANFVGFETAFCEQTTGCSKPWQKRRCASACALIYYATNERFGSEVFVHRPTFPADMFAGLSGKEAQSAYDGAIDRLIGELQAHRVSDEQIQQMMKIPSNELIKLSTALPTDSPWLDEWLAAKCGPTESTTGTNYKALLCKVDAVTSEERRVQRKS